MRRALVLAFFAAGCGRELNPEFCAHNPSDEDCLAHDLVMLDAPTGCPAVPCGELGRPVCEVSMNMVGNCVQCIPAGSPGADPAQCPTDQTCGPDRVCHACLVDTDCKDSKVCLSTGTCALTSNVLYAAPAPAGTGTLCTLAMPCTFSTAVSNMLSPRNIVKLTTTMGTDYSEPPIVIPMPGTIIGTGATFTPMGAGPGISMSKLAGDGVEILGLTVQAATAQGIFCDQTKLAVRRASLIGNGTYGVETSKCDATIERSRFLRNGMGPNAIGGGMFLNDGTFEVRNNIVGPDNGNDNLTTGAIRVEKAKGRLVFNTVAKNKSEQGGGDRQGALRCGASGMLFVAHNIFTSNGGANGETGGDCVLFSNYVGNNNTFADLHFSGLDFHLTALSPTSDPVIRNDSQAEPACHLPAIENPATPHIDDIDGQARPFDGFCDRGADEYLP